MEYEKHITKEIGNNKKPTYNKEQNLEGEFNKIVYPS
jgi:hypothetical protein